MSRQHMSSRSFVISVLICILILFSSNMVNAQTATRYTDLLSWEAVVFGSELFQTTAANVAFADEIGTVPGNNTNVGSILNYQSANTGLSRGFQIKTGQADADFVFNNGIGSGSSNDWLNALSVGDFSTHHDDDWSISLLGGATMSAFGIELRNNKYEVGESFTFINTDPSNSQNFTVFLSDLATNVSSNDFIGFTTDFHFNKVVFNEGEIGDDIAIADLRFADATYSTTPVAPEPISSILFIAGGATLGIRRFWNKRKA